jgi:hypothetical protein
VSDEGQVRVRGPWGRRSAGWVEVAQGSLSVSLPALFGAGRPWRVPLEDAVVVDLAGLSRSDRLDGSTAPAQRGPAAFRDPVTLTSLPGAGRPDLVLLFATPQRLPALRSLAGAWSRLPVRASRSSDGSWSDGVALRAAEPARAVELLVHAGLAATSDPVGWILARRATTSDSAAVADAVRRDGRRRRARLATAGLSSVLKGQQ